MRILKRLGLVFLAVCAFSALAVSSASASPKFLSTVAGALLLASAGNFQKFHTKPGFVECEKLKLLPPGDTAPALESLLILVVVDYQKCTAFGTPALVTPVRYIIDANGLVTLEADIQITGATACHITVPAAKNQSLTTVNFDNNTANNGILLLATVKHITSSGTGGPGGICEYKEESEGEYFGTVHVTLHGGTIKWDP